MERHSVDFKRSTKRRIALQTTGKSLRDTLYAPKILRRVSPITTGKYHTITVFKDSIQEGCFSFWLHRHRRLASGLHVAYRRKDNVWNQFYSFYAKRTLCFDTLKLPTRYFICVAWFLTEKCVSTKEIDTSGSSSPIKYKTWVFRFKFKGTSKSQRKILTRR